MITDVLLPPSPALHTLRLAYRCDERELLQRLLLVAQQDEAAMRRIQTQAEHFVTTVRARRREGSGIDALMHEYQLSTPEGVVLMCLAEALLRIPDEETSDLLIRDKLLSEDWAKHLGSSDSLFVNASTFGLMVSGRVLRADESLGDRGHSVLRTLLQRTSEPVLRAMLRHAMRILGKQFVMGHDIEVALRRSRDDVAHGFRHSYDMLGEAARTAADSERYYRAYLDAIGAIGNAAVNEGPILAPGISIKLSALHPRYEFSQSLRVRRELYPRLLVLCEASRDAKIGLTIDAEESERLELSLMLLRDLMHEPSLRQWQGLGLAVQAYQRRAYDTIAWLGEQASSSKRRLMVRLVKGAYWDSEIKRTQELGLSTYPVFTRKAATDVSYLACANALLAKPALFYPQFATHNAHTVAAVLELARAAGVSSEGLEFQRLHGMGAPLHEAVLEATGFTSRIYSPVGSHEALLPYLVRRLLENGANSSFVNRIADDGTPISKIIADPRSVIAATGGQPHPRIPDPSKLYQDRLNSSGYDLSDVRVHQRLQQQAQDFAFDHELHAPLIPNGSNAGAVREVRNPANRSQIIGDLRDASLDDVQLALAQATDAFATWNSSDVATRAGCLLRAAAMLQERMPEFIALIQAEAGKTLSDAIGEIREAIDFCRYYAERAKEDFAPEPLPGVTGESSTLTLEGRGLFVCISPWNFPLSIFVGQVAAALVAGNVVIAKPAEQTSLTALSASKLLLDAGIPEGVLQVLPGSGAHIGAALISDSRVSGVAFTGGTATAWTINRGLAAREGPIATFIAETGGLNAMLVDSSALPEQVCADVLSSAFQSAGQRCSALRLLLLQDDIADSVIQMLAGAMAEITIGDPRKFATDVGPVIDDAALSRLHAHAEKMNTSARLIHRCTLPSDVTRGTFFAPTAYEISSLDQLPGEVFGPILHVLRFARDSMDDVIDQLNARGFGLTFGVQSRIDTTIDRVSRRIRAGNVYVNRNIIGAVVGSHPFGGLGLSGTGPKAGGPDYVRRFAVEKTITRNTTAAGGNASLMTLGE